MPIEAATYINQLNPANPPAGDLLKESDDHQRLTKQTLVNTFPNLDSPVLASPAELNLLVGQTVWPTPFVPVYDTFQVTISAGSGTITIDPADDTLGYILLGDLVFVHGMIVVQSVSTPSGVLKIDGMPFTADALIENADYWGFHIIIHLGALAFTGRPEGRIGGVIGDSDSIQIIDAQDTTITQCADHIGANTQIYISGWYRRS